MRTLRLACVAFLGCVAFIALTAHAQEDECQNSLRLTDASPSYAFTTRAQDITLTGCFGADPTPTGTKVFIKDLPCAVTEVTTTQVKCTLGDHALDDAAAGYGDVRVVSEDLNTEVELTYSFVYLNPVILEFNPAQVRNDITTEVRIEFKGPALPDQPKVMIGGIEAEVSYFNSEQTYLMVLTPQIPEKNGTVETQILFADPLSGEYVAVQSSFDLEYVTAPTPDEPSVETVAPDFLIATDDFNKDRTIKIQGHHLDNAVKVTYMDIECQDFKLAVDEDTNGQEITCNFPTCDPEQCTQGDQLLVLDAEGKTLGAIEFNMIRQPSVGGALKPHSAVPGNFADEVEFTVPITNARADSVQYSLSLDDTEFVVYNAKLLPNNHLSFSPPPCNPAATPEEQGCVFNKAYSLVIRNVWGHLLYKSPADFFTYLTESHGPSITNKLQEAFIGDLSQFNVEGAWFKHFKVSKVTWNPSNDFTNTIDATVSDVEDNGMVVSHMPCRYPEVCAADALYDLTMYGADGESIVGVGSKLIKFSTGALYEGHMQLKFPADTVIDDALLLKVQDYVVNKFAFRREQVIVTHPHNNHVVSVVVVDFILQRDENTKFTIEKLHDAIVAPDSDFAAQVAALESAGAVDVTQQCPNGKFLKNCSSDPDGKKSSGGFDGAIIAYIVVPIVVLVIGVFVYRRWKARRDRMSIQGLLDDHAAYNDINEY